MAYTVVLGIGNRLMCDDGIGVRIAETLGHGQQCETVRYTAGETDVDYCLNELADADRCIIIDGACSAGGFAAETGRPSHIKPCSVKVIDLKEVFAQKRHMASFHDFDLIHAMKRENMKKEGILITVEICSVELSAELSPAMREQFDGICGEVKEKIDRYLLSGTIVMESGSR